MMRRSYGIFNITPSHFNLTDEEFVVYAADIRYTEAHNAYYHVLITYGDYIKLKFRFWKMRLFGRSKVRIRKIP